MDRLTLTPQELDYLRSQRLGRLATVDGGGAPQNNPVGFFIDEATGQVLIGGFNLAQSRKFRNLAANPNVAFVVDDLASVDPWTPRGVEMRGWARPSPTPTRRCRDSAGSSSASPRAGSPAGAWSPERRTR